MKCKTCNKITENKTYCSRQCNQLRPYTFETHSYCRNCGEWREKGQIMCNECHKRISHRPRFTKVKDPNRWLKAY